VPFTPFVSLIDGMRGGINLIKPHPKTPLHRMPGKIFFRALMNDLKTGTLAHTLPRENTGRKNLVVWERRV